MTLLKLINQITWTLVDTLHTKKSPKTDASLDLFGGMFFWNRKLKKTSFWVILGETFFKARKSGKITFPVFCFNVPLITRVYFNGFKRTMARLKDNRKAQVELFSYVLFGCIFTLKNRENSQKRDF